jgi:hypothetical protein
VKKKNRKQRKRKKFARHELRAVHAKRRGSVPKKKVERASTPWLRILSAGIEDDPTATVSRGPVSHRNGRRRPRDLDLYISKDNSQSR